MHGDHFSLGNFVLLSWKVPYVLPTLFGNVEPEMKTGNDKLLCVLLRDQFA
jgi:hypothetical protein